VLISPEDREYSGEFFLRERTNIIEFHTCAPSLILFSIKHDNPVFQKGGPPMDQRPTRNITPLLVVFLLLFTFVHANAATKFVDATASGANNGTSWTNAYTDLQIALGTSVAGDEIWVAAGTYKPTSGVSRTASFWLAGGVAVYGGFAGGETMISQRDWAANVTILSGDIGIVGNTADNSFHVVKGNWTNSAVLDGFTVTAGRADVSPDHTGGGMINDHGNSTIRNVVFQYNYASHSGGGMRNDAASPTLFNVYFRDNYSDTDGGGMYNFESSAPKLVEVTFFDNTAFEDGAGMYNDASSPILDQVTFRANTCSGTPALGGGMHNTNNSNPDMTDVIFTGNEAEHGGGMYNSGGSAPVLKRVTFLDNDAWRGAGIYSDGADPSLVNVLFYGNKANGTNALAGGMYNRNNSPELVNVTFSGNTADDGSGGGMFNFNSTPEITNVILWGNYAVTSGNEIHNVSSTPVISNSLIENCGGSGGSWDTALGTDGGNNIEADPLFKNTTTGDLSLWSSSPAVNAGDSSALPAGTTTDLAGNTRIYGAQVDMGAYEVQSPATGIGDDVTSLAQGVLLRSAYPNPFNPAVTIAFELAQRKQVQMSIFDAGGRLVQNLVDGVFDPGTHKVTWNGRDKSHTAVSSGMYFVRIESDGRVETKKIVLLK
jgi:hypothetical protein